MGATVTFIRPEKPTARMEDIKKAIIAMKKEKITNEKMGSNKRESVGRTG